jgi:HEAT repeat protein
VSKQAFDQKLEALKSLRTAAELRKPLQDRNNYVASKAAEMIANLNLQELIPDLLKAFDRFLEDPVKADPQCWAKNAISKALQQLGHRDADVYLKGSAHIQLEPVWGGAKDSAGPLRSVCALALIDCRLDVLKILIRLTDLLSDKELTVRVSAAQAIGMLGSAEGVLPLRLKALIGDEEPEVIGQCFSSLSGIAPEDSIAFIRRFLQSPKEDMQAEAASVLAQSRDPEALRIVITFLRGQVEPRVRTSILLSLGASPLREAADYLLSVLRDHSGDTGATAIAALAASRFRDEVRDAVKAAVEEHDESKLSAEFRRAFD